jgi:hypothetical protein
MDERVRELEERLARAEESLRLLATHLAVTPDEGLRLTAPLRVMDSDGKPMLELDLGESGPRLCLLNGAGDPALVLDVLTTGGSISISNAAGRAVALLFADETGGDLALYDNDGKLVFSEP